MKRNGSAPASGLIFPWQDKPASFWRLIPYLAFCVLVLTGFFILFKISYPAGDPMPRSTQGILVLDADLPAHQLILNRAYDKSSLILKPELEIASYQGTPMLPLFRPSFQGYSMKLKDTAQQESPAISHRLFLPEDLALPKISGFSRPAPSTSEHPAPRQFALKVRFSGPLSSRRVSHPSDLAEMTPQDLSRLRFHMTVNSLGRVVLTLPVSHSIEDRPLIPVIQSALSQMRFAPQPGTGNQNDLATFDWSSP